MAKFRLLDLYCCAGGASWGYHLAGFEVVGVDIAKQPRYPLPFIRADVLDMDPRFLATFDVIHASPPCQFATLLKHAPGGKEHPNLIPPTRALLKKAGVPYIIENVEPAAPHLVNPTMLCGTMFDLGAEGCELRRHRYFETSFHLAAPCACQHGDGPVIGVYGGHARRRSAKHGGRGTRDVWKGGHIGAASEAMEMAWASLGELSEAIPPAYTHHIGRAALEHIASVRAGRALRFLADVERPAQGDQQPYNVEHLRQIAADLPSRPDKDGWMIVFEEAGKTPLTFSGHGAEQAAHRTFKRMLTQWNCHLFQTIALSEDLAR